MEKYLPLSEDEKKKMQPWKTGAVKYPQVSIVRQPCTIAESTSDPESCGGQQNVSVEIGSFAQDPSQKGDGDKGFKTESTVINMPITEEQAAGTSRGAHFCFGKPSKKESDSENRSQVKEKKSKEIDPWFDTV
ncbi:hypothetical protein Trydic_g8 [Trypoxylus dichotomus]